MSAITKAERKDRERYVRGGAWDDAVLYLADGRSWHADRCVMAGTDLVVYSGNNVLRWDVADVVRVVR